MWIEGDNKLQSFDSREYGPIPIQMVQGKAIMRVRILKYKFIKKKKKKPLRSTNFFFPDMAINTTGTYLTMKLHVYTLRVLNRSEEDYPVILIGFSIPFFSVVNS